MNTAINFYSSDETEGEKSNYNIPEKIRTDIISEGSSPLTIDDISSDTFNENTSNIPSINIVPKTTVVLEGKFKLLQLWEGRIIKVRQDEFDAIIEDKTNPAFADELVTIDKQEITPEDIDFIKEGSVFYWSIGFLDYPGRGRSKESKIRFRRLKGWTEKEIKSSKEIGKEFAEFFKSNPA